MIMLYYPSILAKFNINTDCCPLCNNMLDVQNQYLYMKKYKDECSVCMKYNDVDTPYCLCEQSDDYIIKTKMITCHNCNSYPKKCRSIPVTQTKCYKDLYKLAKDKNIKYRSLMSKEELMAACA